LDRWHGLPLRLSHGPAKALGAQAFACKGAVVAATATVKRAQTYQATLADWWQNVIRGAVVFSFAGRWEDSVRRPPSGGLERAASTG
jgi:hypothetical protein